MRRATRAEIALIPTQERKFETIIATLLQESPGTWFHLDWTEFANPGKPATSLQALIDEAKDQGLMVDVSIDVESTEGGVFIRWRRPIA